MGFFKDLWGKIASLFSKVDFKEVMSAVFTAGTTLLLGRAWEMAANIVDDVSKEDLTDEAKRTAAFDKIKLEATDQGLKLKDSLINLIIEIAVTYFKNRK